MVISIEQALEPGLVDGVEVTRIKKFKIAAQIGKDGLLLGGIEGIQVGLGEESGTGGVKLDSTGGQAEFASGLNELGGHSSWRAIGGFLQGQDWWIGAAN